MLLVLLVVLVVLLVPRAQAQARVGASYPVPCPAQRPAFAFCPAAATARRVLSARASAGSSEAPSWALMPPPAAALLNLQNSGSGPRFLLLYMQEYLAVARRWHVLLVLL